MGHFGLLAFLCGFLLLDLLVATLVVSDATHAEA